MDNAGSKRTARVAAASSPVNSRDSNRANKPTVKPGNKVSSRVNSLATSRPMVKMANAAAKGNKPTASAAVNVDNKPMVRVAAASNPVNSRGNNQASKPTVKGNKVSSRVNNPANKRVKASHRRVRKPRTLSSPARAAAKVVADRPGVDKRVGGKVAAANRARRSKRTDNNPVSPANSRVIRQANSPVNNHKTHKPQMRSNRGNNLVRAAAKVVADSPVAARRAAVRVAAVNPASRNKRTVNNRARPVNPASNPVKANPVSSPANNKPMPPASPASKSLAAVVLVLRANGAARP